MVAPMQFWWHLVHFRDTDQKASDFEAVAVDEAYHSRVSSE